MIETNLLTHAPTHSLSHLLTDVCIHPFTYSLIYLLTHTCPLYKITCSCKLIIIHLLTHSLTYLLTHLVTNFVCCAFSCDMKAEEQKEQLELWEQALKFFLFPFLLKYHKHICVLWFLLFIVCIIYGIY